MNSLNEIETHMRLLSLIPDEHSKSVYLTAVVKSNPLILDLQCDTDKKFDKILTKFKVQGYETINDRRAMAAEARISSGFGDLNARSPAHKFIHHNWVNLYDLLPILDTMRKGEQHQLLHKLMQLLNDNWEETYRHNTNANYRRLVHKLKDLNVSRNATLQNRDEKRSKFKHSEVQMFKPVTEGIKDASRQLATTALNVDHKLDNLTTVVTRVANKLEQTIGKSEQHIGQTSYDVRKMTGAFKTVAEKAESVLDRINAGITSVSNMFLGGEESHILVYFLRLLAVGYTAHSIVNCDMDNKVSVLVSLFFITLPPRLVENLTSNVMSTLNRVVKGVMEKWVNRSTIEVQANGFEEVVVQSDCKEETNFLMEILSLVKNMLKATFTTANSDVFDKMYMTARRLKIFSSIILSSRTIIDFFGAVVQTLVSLVADVIMRYYGVLPSFFRKDELTPLIDRYQRYRLEEMDKTALSNQEHALFVIELRNELVKLEATWARKMNRTTMFEHIKVIPFVRAMLTHLEKTVAHIPPHVRGDLVRRNKPWWLYIFGAPRKGKSSMFQPLIISILAKELGLINKYEPVDNYTFTRNPNEEFWDGYNGQPVVQYNDVFQVQDKEKINRLIDELGSIVDDVPLPLLICDADHKGQVYFKSQLVVTNAQSDINGVNFIRTASWSGGTHLYQRRNVVVELFLNPYYELPDGTINLAQLQVARDSGIHFINNLLPQDMYTLKFFDATTGLNTHTTTLLDGIKQIVESAKRSKIHSGTFKTELYKAMEDYWQSGLSVKTHVQMDGSEEYLEPLCAECSMMAVRVCGRNGWEVPIDFIEKFPHQHLCPDFNTMERFIQAHQAGRPFKVQDIGEFDSTSICSSCESMMDEMSHCFSVPPGIARQFLIEHTIKEHDCYTNLEKMFDDYMAFRDKDILTRLDPKPSNKIKEWCDIARNRVQSAYAWCKTTLRLCPLAILLSILTAGGLIFTIMSVFNNKTETASAEMKVVKKQVKAQRKAEVQGYDDTNVALEKIIERNTCRLVSYVWIDGIRYPANLRGAALCVISNIIVMPRHYAHCIKDMMTTYACYDVKFDLELHWNKEEIHTVSMDKIEFYYPPHEHQTDLAYAKIVGLSPRRDLSKFFIRDGSELRLTGAYLYGLRGGEFAMSYIHMGTPSLSNVVAMFPGYTVLGTDETIPTREYKMANAYYYRDAPCVRGDCGMLLLSTDTTLAHRRILGMHTSGLASKSIGVSTPIFFEDIEEMRNEFGLDCIVTDAEFAMVQLGAEPQSKIAREIDMVQKLGAGKMFDFIGKKIKARVELTRKTRIRESISYDLMVRDFGDTHHYPARLTPFVIDDVRISPIVKALSKLKAYSAGPSLAEQIQIREHINETIETWHTKVVERRLLTDFETINGTELINGLDMTTSSGFPWTKVKPGSKAVWFNCTILENGQKLYDMLPELEERVQYRIENAKNYRAIETMFTITLKDETRLLEKVRQGKTRIFQVGPVDLTIAMRKYFGQFLAHFHGNPVENETAVGIDPSSIQWKLLYNRLRKHGIEWGCGDMENMDATEAYEVCMLLADVANEWYQDEDCNKRVRKTLLSTCLNNTQIVEDMVIERKQGNTSGNWLTTCLNCFIMMFILRLTYIRNVCKSLTKYSQQVETSIFGDDHLFSADKEIRSQFNMLTVAETAESIGMKYTMPEKDGEVVPFVQCDHVQYLKRKFVRDNTLGVVHAPLDERVVLDICRWAEGDEFSTENQLARYNTTIVELSHYGEERCKQFRERAKKHFRELKERGYILDQTRLFTYRDALHIRFPEKFSRDIVRDLALYGQQHKIGLLDDGELLGSIPMEGKYLEYIAPDNGYAPCDEQSLTGNFLRKSKQEDFESQSAEDKKQQHVAKARRVTTQNLDVSPYFIAYEEMEVQSGDIEPSVYIDHPKAAVTIASQQETYAVAETRLTILTTEELNVIEKRCDVVVRNLLKVFGPLVKTLYDDVKGLLYKTRFNSGILRDLQVLSQRFFELDRWLRVYEQLEIRETMDDFGKDKDLGFGERRRSTTPVVVVQGSSDEDETESFEGSETFALLNCMQALLGSHVYMLRDLMKPLVEVSNYINQPLPPKMSTLDAKLLTMESLTYMKPGVYMTKTQFYSRRPRSACRYTNGSIEEDSEEIRTECQADMSTGGANKPGTTETAGQNVQFKDRNEIVGFEPDIDIEQLDNPYVPVDMDIFVERFQLLTTFNLSTTAAAGSKLFSSRTLLQSLFELSKDKIDGIMFMSPDVELQVRCNATMVDYGSVLISWLPHMPAAAAERYHFYNSACTNPNSVYMRIGKQQTVSIGLPFVHMADRIRVDEQDLESGSKPYEITVEFYVVNPLTHSTGENCNVTFAIYGRYVNPRFVGLIPRGYEPVATASLIGRANRRRTKERAFIENAFQVAQLRTEVQMEHVRAGMQSYGKYRSMWNSNKSRGRNFAASKGHGGTWDKVATKVDTAISYGDKITQGIQEHSSSISQAFADVDKNIEQKKATRGGNLKPSDITDIAGDFTSKFESIPIIGEVAKVATAVTSLAGGVLRFFGFGIPANLSSETPIVRYTPRLNYIEDHPVSQFHGIKPGEQTVKDFGLVNGNMADMLLLSRAQTPTLIASRTVLPTIAVGTKLIDVVLDARNFKPYAGDILANISLVAQLFRMVRGGIRVAFTVDCSPLHSFRLAVAYIPDDSIELEFEDLVNVAVDIVEVTDSCDLLYVFPMIEDTDWVHAGDSIGRVEVWLMSSICGAGVGDSPVYINTWVSAAADFQVAMPVQGTFVKTFLAPNDPEVVEVQMAEGELMNVSVARFPSATNKGLKEAQYQPLGASGEGHLNTSYTSQTVDSFRQLANQQKPTFIFDTNGTTKVYLPLLSHPSSTSFCGNLQLIRALFCYVRGSVRLTMHIVGHQNYTVDSYVYFYESWKPWPDFEVKKSASAPFEDTNVSLAGYHQVSARANAGTFDWVLPWNMIYKSHNTCDDSLNFLIPTLVVRIANDTGITTKLRCMVSYGAGDDFIAGYPLPLMKMGYAQLPKKIDILRSENPEDNVTTTLTPAITTTTTLEPTTTTSKPTITDAPTTTGRITKTRPPVEPGLPTTTAASMRDLLMGRRGAQ